MRRRSCGGILRKSGHIRGAKQDSLNEYPYRQAFEKMNDADFGCLDKMNEKRDHGFVLVYPSLGECSLLFHCSSWVISFVYRYLKAPSD